MTVTRPVIEKQESWRRGEIKAFEPQKIPLNSLVRSENWESQLDGSLLSSPGFATEFTVALHRQIADMEDREDSLWAGSVADDLVNFQYGFQSRNHVHGGAGALNSTFTRSLAFLGDVFNGTTDRMNFRFRATDISELASIEVRFREGGGDYFTTTISMSGWADNVWQLEQVLQSAFTVSGTPQWDQIVDMFIITTAAAVDAAGVVTIAFDDFFIDRPADTVGEPIWDVFGFERVGTPERYLMVSSGSEIWSYLGPNGTKRMSSLDANRPINMIVANDMVISANGADNIKRWFAGDSTFRDVGVPVAPDTIIGAENVAVGNVGAGTYFFATVFDMGIHGEGNAVSPRTSSVVIAAANRRIDYTVIPIGPPGTTRRLIYRTVAGGGAAGALQLDVIINDNTTLVGQSNVADANLGATLAQDGDQPLIGSMLEYANRTLFMAGVAGFESSVFHSDTTRAVNRTIEQWPVLNEFRLNPHDGDRITGMIYFQRYIYVFKRNSTWILDPIQLGAPLMISSTYGSIGHRCLVDAGSVLYAWSDEHGPLEIRGQTITPIGILESNLEREGPRVGDINGNPQATVGILGSLITTQNDFQESGSTFTNTSGTEVPGSVTLDRISGPGTSQDTNLAALLGASAFGTIVQGAGRGAENVRDGNVDSGAVFLPIDTVGNTMTATLTITLVQSSTVSRIKTWMFHRDGSLSGIPAKVDVQYEVSAGNFVTVGTFFTKEENSNLVVSEVPKDPFLDEVNFGPVTSQRFRLNITWGPFLQEATFPDARSLLLLEFQIFASGFVPSGEWISAPQDLGQVPAGWGRFNSNFVLPPTGNLTFFMRSAATSGGLTAENFEVVTPAVAPDTALIPLREFIQWKVVFASSEPDETPRLDDISILFIPANSNFILPRFESVGIFFDRRYWLSAVGRDDTNPTLVWKYSQLLKGWSRHPGFNMSSWARLSDAFYSGSAIDGRVYRNVKDANGELLRDHAGTSILCLAETKDSAPTGQDHTSTVLNFTAVCRNEARNTKNLIRNPSFEDWPNVLGPAAWEFEGSINDGQEVSREIDPRNIVTGTSSLLLDWGNPSISAFVWSSVLKIVVGNTSDLLIREDVSLKPDTDYTLTYYAKKDSGAAMNIFRIQDFRSDGNHEFLRNDGTWGALVDEFIGDNTTISETMTKRTVTFRTNSADPDHAFYRIQYGYLISTNATPGLTWLDEITLFETSQSISRNLHVLPILDGKDNVPERRINLNGGDDGILDVGVIRKQFRIDKALVRNVRFRLRHQEPEARAKVLGIYVKSNPEEWRQ